MQKYLVLIVFAFYLTSCSKKTTSENQNAHIPADSTTKVDSVVNSETKETNSFSKNKNVTESQNVPTTVPIKVNEKPQKNENKKTSVNEVKAEAEKLTEKPIERTPVVKPKLPQENDFPKFPSNNGGKPVNSGNGGGQAAPVKAPKIEPAGGNEQANSQKPLSHAIWDGLVKKYISAEGKVNYAAIQKNKAQLDAYLDVLTDNPPQSNWDKNKQLAYWINAYNAFTIKRIIEKYPISSINNIKPWDDKNIQLGDKKYSLNQIENEIIRPQFKDARIHFAVNCAAKSCPKILNEAFAPEKLNLQLEAQTKLFVNNTTENTLSEKKIEISHIFDWYKADFDAVGGVIPFLNKYSNVKIKDNAKVSYKEYNWNLNE
jgi:hypothetical protein